MGGQWLTQGTRCGQAKHFDSCLRAVDEESMFDYAGLDVAFQLGFDICTASWGGKVCGVNSMQERSQQQRLGSRAAGFGV